MYYLAVLVFLPALCLGQGHHQTNSFKPFNETAHDLFVAMDVDGSKQITSSDMHNYFLKYDADGNGQITRHEFTLYIDTQSSHFKGNEHILYDYFDVDSDHHLTEADFNHIFDLNDYDDNGVVTNAEFVSYWSTAFEIIENMD